MADATLPDGAGGAASAEADVPKLDLAAGGGRPAPDATAEGATGSSAGAGAGAGEGAGAGAGETEAPAPAGAMPGEDILLEDAREAKAAGNAFFKDEEWAKAATEYHRGILFMQRLKKEHPDARAAVTEEGEQLMKACLLNVAQAQMHLAIPDAAYKACKMAIGLDPENAKAFFHLSKAEEGLGDVEAARASMLQACKLAPKNKRLRRELTRLTKQVKREQALVRNAFRSYLTEGDHAKAAKADAAAVAKAEAEADAAKQAAKADAGDAGAGGGAGAGGAGGDSDSDSDSGSDSDWTSSSGDGALAGSGAGAGSDEEEVEYSDEAAYRKGVEMGLDADKAGAMVAMGQGPILLAGFKSVEEYERMLAEKRSLDAMRERRRARRAAKQRAAAASSS